MQTGLRNFALDENGAVTVDWVVLTAGVIALNLLLIFTPIRDSVIGVADVIAGVFEEASAYLAGAETEI